MANVTRSPIIGYKIAIVNGANLNNPEHYVDASKRLNRAIRKARIMRMSNSNVMLFGVRQDGTNFAVSLKKPKWEVPTGNGCNSHFIVMPADHEAAVNVARAARKAVAREIRMEA